MADSTNNKNKPTVQIVKFTPDIINTLSGNDRDVIVMDERNGGCNMIKSSSHSAHGNRSEQNISSSYGDLELEVCGKTIVVKGSAKLEAITSCIKLIRGVPECECRVCGFISPDMVNVVAHVAYLHRPQLEDANMSPLARAREFVNTMSFDPQPSTTQPDPYNVSTWYELLGEFSPREYMNPAVD